MCEHVLGGQVVLPVPVGVVCLFVSFMHSQLNLVSGTIATYLSAISYVHSINGLPDPCDSFIVRKMQHGTARMVRDVSLCRLPITLHILHNILDAVANVEASAYRRSLFRAMFSIAFHACCRVGELTKSGKSDHWLKFSDVRFGNNFLVITFRTYKHSVPGYTPSVTLHASNDKYCPVHALTQFVLMRGSQNGPLFCLSDNMPISRKSFTEVLNSCLRFLQLDSSRMTAHSFRIGRATLALEQKMNVEQIRQLGRWKGDAFKKYLRPQTIHL